MSFWLALSVMGVLLIGSIFGYVALRWRRAPKVYRAMNRMVYASAAAGILLGLPVMHWLGSAPSSSSSAGAGSGWERVRDAIAGVCPSGGFPATEVGKYLVLADEHHSGDPLWISTAAQADLCRDDEALKTSQLCVSTFIARHALGLDMDYGDHRSLIPCEEVA